MTITDLINEVKQSRNKVIPTSYILSRLASIERHDNGDYVETLADEDERRLKRINSIWGGDSNRNVIRQIESTEGNGHISEIVASGGGQERRKIKEREYEIEQRLRELADNRRLKKHNIIS